MADRIHQSNAIGDTLFGALRQATLFGVRHTWADWLNQSSRFSPPLRRALTRALRCDKRVTVSRIAEWSGLHRSTVSRQWHREVSRDDSSLKRFTDGLLLLSAAIRRADGTTWEKAARETGVSPRTLRSASRRALGCTSSALQRMDPDRLASAIRDACVPFLPEGPVRQTFRSQPKVGG